MNVTARDYLLQRLSALVMAPLVVTHLALIVYAVRGGLSASEIVARTQGSIGWGTFYTIFVVAAATHATIGVRNVLVEWSPLGSRAAVLLGHALGLLILLLGLRAVYAVIA
jgi:fumarate reductase subunit C